MTTEAKDIAKARADEAELVAEAFAIQLANREIALADFPTPANYKRVVEARAQAAAAKRHLTYATREYKKCR